MTSPSNASSDRLEAMLDAIDPALVARMPLLSSLLGLDIAETELTAPLDAKVRKASLEDLLSVALRARSADHPIILVLEDCHWIDPLSRDLLEVLCRTAASLPVLIVLAYRPAPEVGGGLGIERTPGFTEMSLDVLSSDDAAALIESKLTQVAGATDGAAASEGASDASDELVRLVTDRSGGNPFYIEELISFIASRRIDLADAESLRTLELPESLHSLVLSRIDEMAEAPRRTLKVASVVGRLFEAPVLPGAYPELGPLDEVIVHLDTLRAADLVNLDRVAEQAYLFKHVATQEVAYESLPFALRTMLHGRVGRWLEAAEPEAIEQRLDLLAHHFWLSDDDGRKRTYLSRAADAARSAYANEAAIRYLERLIPLLEGSERVSQTIPLAQTLHVTGDIPRAEAIMAVARALAADIGDVDLVARCDHSLAESARRLGRFDDAEALLERARAGFVDVGDRAGEADVLQVTGTVAAQRGDTTLARERYLESLAIREELGDESGVAALTSNLGIVAQQQGDGSAAARATPTARSPSTRSWATAAGSGPARSTSPGWTGWRATTNPRDGAARRRSASPPRSATG